MNLFSFLDRFPGNNSGYLPSKTVNKAALPIGIVVLVNLLLSYAKSHGIEIDAETLWTIAGCGYGCIVACINYVKNHRKKI